MQCPSCHSDRTRRVLEIRNAGTSIASGTGFGYATDGSVVLTNLTAVIQTLEAAGLEPPKKLSYFNVYFPFMVMLFALMNFPMKWAWLVIWPALLFAAYHFPIIWNQRNRVYPELLRHYGSMWKCNDCSHAFDDPAFQFRKDVKDWVWKEVLTEQFKWTVGTKLMLGVAGMIFVYPFALSFSLAHQMPYLGGFIFEYLFAFVLVGTALVKARHAARKQRPK